MKIAYITPGSGGTFYCQNCFLDSELLQSMHKMGLEVFKVPMYLPTNLDATDAVTHTPVFYGAINVFLKEKVPFYRHAPLWLERLFDSEPFLQFAAKKSGSTKASGLEEMTLSMLNGEKGRQASELDHLIKYLAQEIKPDVVHLSNALLLGLARRLKHDLDAAVVCSLQDENEWIGLMDESYQKKVWALMSERARDVDQFITGSHFSAKKSKKQMDIPADKISVIYGGINLEGYEISKLPTDPPVIGYLCRMSEYFGLGILVDAFLELKKKPEFEKLRLHLNGGYSAEDKPFVNRTVEKIRESGHSSDVTLFKQFKKEDRIQFLKGLTLLSVPVPSGEAFGAYLVEALAAGVPLVQPKAGCYPEFIDLSQGGIIYHPNTPGNLAEAISSLLKKPEKIQQMAETGRRNILDRFSMEEMSLNMVTVYRDLRGKG